MICAALRAWAFCAHRAAQMTPSGARRAPLFAIIEAVDHLLLDGTAPRRILVRGLAAG
jgi:hypothetical protein